MLSNYGSEKHVVLLYWCSYAIRTSRLNKASTFRTPQYARTYHSEYDVLNILIYFKCLHVQFHLLLNNVPITSTGTYNLGRQ